MAREDPALTRHVKDLFPDLEHLFEAAEQVVALQAQPGWAVLQRLLGAEVDAINATMESGKTLEQAEYTGRHGRVGGLKGAQSMADAIVGLAERRRAEQAAKHEGDAESSPER
jgi:hypothetical protein